MTQVKKSFFTTTNLPEEKRLPAWRESISTLFDVTPDHLSPKDSFNATLTSYLLNDQVMFSLCQTTSQRFIRSSLSNAKDGLDYYLIQTHVSGSQDVCRAGKETNSAAGDLLVIDLADKHAAMTSDFSHLTLVIPRHLLAPHLIHPDSQEGRVLKGDDGLTTLAVSHMRTLGQIIETLSPEQAAATIEPTLMLLASALNGSPETVEGGATAAALSLRTRAKLAIENNLHRKLSADVLCQMLNLSRATLYRLFAPYGGVRAYIQDRRLRRCAETLFSPVSVNRPIHDIAFEWGFSNEAHFSRAFKNKFGVSPRDARHTELSLVSEREIFPEEKVGDRDYETWLIENLKT